MASLKNTFLEATNPSKNPFYSIVPYLQLFTSKAKNIDDLCYNKRSQKKLNTSPTKQISFFKPIAKFKNPTLNLVNRLINQNINNFSQLSDCNLNDFKDC